MIGAFLAWLDGILVFLPLGLRVGLLGLVSGALTMGVYGWLSPQEGLKKLRDDIAEAREALQNYDGDDFQEILSRSKRALGLSLQQLRVMFPSTIIAALPLLLLLTWMEGYYTFATPAPGDEVKATIVPTNSGIPEGVRWDGDGVDVKSPSLATLRWPSADADNPPRLEAGDGTLVELPLAHAYPELVHESVVHLVLSNPAGYLPDTAPIRAVTFDLPERHVLPFGPDWLRTWHAVFFAMLSVGAIAVKVGFRIT